MKTPVKNMRLEMPNTAESIDLLREAFGVSTINQQIKSGMQGLPTFYAIENGVEVGTAARRSTSGFEIDGADFLRIGQLCRDNHKLANKGKEK
jgi:hypothetical protein